MKQLEPVDEKLKPEIEDILERIKRGEDINLSSSEALNDKERKKQLVGFVYLFSSFLKIFFILKLT